MKRIIFAITISLMPFIHAYAEEINIKLACKGTSWVDGKTAENNQGFISIANGTVKISGMLIADGVYKVDLASVREDFLGFRSQKFPLLHGSINRITGDAIVIESDKKEPTKGGQALFNGNCVKAKQLF